MITKPSLVDSYLPSLGGWWLRCISSPWLFVALLIVGVLSVRRHGVLSYGSYKATFWGLFFALVCFGEQMLWGFNSANIGLIALLIIVMLSDSIVDSISHSRSPFFVYDIGLLLGLLFIIHPAFLLLIPYFILKLRRIKSGTIKHIIALLVGVLTILLIATISFARRDWSGVVGYWASWLVPIKEIHWGDLKDVVIMLLNAIYLMISSFAIWQLYHSSTIRVRAAISFHLQLAWILMALHLFFGSENYHLGFLLGSLFLCSTMVDYLLTDKHSRWVLFPLIGILLTTIGLGVWL